MARLIALLALAGSLSACSSMPFASAPVSNMAPAAQSSRPSPMGVPIPGIPASQYECMTDDGYGRAWPCGTMN